MKKKSLILQATTHMTNTNNMNKKNMYMFKSTTNIEFNL